MKGGFTASELADFDRIDEEHDSTTERAVIQLCAGEGAAAVHAAVNVLAADGEVFNRTGTLVRVIERREARALGLHLHGDESIRRDESQPVIVPLTADYLRVRLDELVRFERYDGRAKAMRPVDCPKDIAAGVLSLGEWEGIAPLRAIARAPFLRADGTVCFAPGYDEPTATLLFPNGRILPVPVAPDREAAVSALATLRAPFDEVPWQEAMYESAFLAYVLTLATRPILPTAPAAIFSAPTAGTGKTLLMDCGGIIVHGAAPAKRNYPGDGDEMRKVLQAALLAGDAVLAFDNLRRGASIGGDALSAYLTADVVADRTLGRSEAPRVVNSAVFAFSGNNVGAEADFVRRSLAVKLDPNCEHPEERTFRIPDLRGHLLRHRPELVRAVLTMLRAFVVAGAPKPTRPLLGSFEAWDALVCGCLLWLGLPDPLETQQSVRADDPEAVSAAALLDALETAFAASAGTFKAADVRAVVARDAPGQPGPLAEAINGACGDVKQLGYWLRGHNGQIHSGRKLVRQTGSTTGQASWRIVRTSGTRKEGCEG
jgi:putative DNA primase/helicase